MTDVMPPPATTSLEAEIQRIGAELWSRIRGEVPGIFNKGFWQGKILDWAMADPSFKIDLLRFVDTGEEAWAKVTEYYAKKTRVRLNGDEHLPPGMAA